MVSIEDYIPIAGQAAVDNLKTLAQRLRGKSVQNINSTAVGGGVAEILNHMVPLLNNLGINTRWDVIKGGQGFFDVTKKIHNGLHGHPVEFTQKDKDIFLEATQDNVKTTETNSDIVFVHDPQPAGLIEKKSGNKWIWRCHIDLSQPQEDVWAFVRQFVEKYDAAVFSAPSFARKMPMRQFLIAPSIDPLSDKNKELEPEVINKVLRKYEIPRDKPIITQISRFDRLKDPVGVVEAYKKVKRYIDCRLILAGGTAVDDPEGVKVFEEVKERAGKDEDVHLLLLAQNDIEVNALQWASDVIMQKSLKEGFGLTISEALWKAKPVVAGYTGGIPLQITHKYSGLLSYSVDGTALALRQLLNSPAFAKRLGENGREHVRRNFLITRHIQDYLLLFLSQFYQDDVVYL